MSKEHKDLGLLAEMGTGKTCAMINILRHKFYEYGRPMRTLILSPQVTLFNWRDEVLKHSYMKHNDVVVLHKAGSVGKLKQMQRELSGINSDKIIVVNYEALLSEKLLKEINDWGPEILICDEAHYVKSPKSKRSKAIFKLSQQCKHRYIMTGTPILNSIMDIFMQFKILDGGETFGQSQFVFQKKYMRDENESWKGRSGYFPKWVPRVEKYDELQDLIYQKAIRVLKKDCLDLPPLVKKTLNVQLSAEQKKYYDEMKQNFLTYVNEQAVVAELAVTKALRLQQIVTGFVQTEDKKVIEITKNPRLDAVKDLLIVLQSNHKIILWCCFRHNYVQLGRLCEELGIDHVFLTGEMSLDEKREAMEQFNKCSKTRVIIANRRAGGIGVNLVAASYAIVYSRNFNLSDELQSEARNHRGGSQIHERIVKIDLCAKNTLDEAITFGLQNKQDMSKNIIDLVKEH